MGEPRWFDGFNPWVRMFDLAEVGEDTFAAANPQRGFGERVFGGQVAAQALWAATRTVADDQFVHSLHSYFLLAGQPEVPITYVVERQRDGRSFSTRGVEAFQGDDLIFSFTASFHRTEDGADYQQPIATDVPAPDDAPTRLLFIDEAEADALPWEMRELGPTEPDADGFYRSTRRAWMRLKPTVPDDPVLHACLLTMLSDMGSMVVALAPLPEQPLAKLVGASLDHAIWFHRPMRADEWFLYDGQAVSNAGARGLMRATMHSADGTLGASVVQEALLRIRP